MRIPYCWMKGNFPRSQMRVRCAGNSNGGREAAQQAEQAGIHYQVGGANVIGTDEGIKPRPSAIRPRTMPSQRAACNERASKRPLSSPVIILVTGRGCLVD